MSVDFDNNNSSEDSYVITQKYIGFIYCDLFQTLNLIPYEWRI